MEHPPATPGQTGRRIVYEYGAQNSVDAVISRLTKIRRFSGQPIGDFTFAGAARRASTLLGGVIDQTFRTSGASGEGLGGFDQFGRVGDLRYADAASGTMFRGQYSYDLAGNRTVARITQAPAAGLLQDNIRSQLNTYDELGRLSSTKVGTLDSNNTITAPAREDTWTLDLFGNWAGKESAYGREAVGNLDNHGNAQSGWPRGINAVGTVAPWLEAGQTPDSAADSDRLTLAANARNELTFRSRQRDGGAVSSSSARYDASGNLSFDGEYVYQYDAWGRLIQINRGTPSSSGPGFSVGLLVKGYSYDAWGRLSRIVSPFPEPGSAQVRVERLHYDGVRRIQEVVTDPVLNLGDSADQGNAEAQEQVGEGVSGETLPGSVNDPVPGTTLSWVEREYVWGPGDSFAGVDELLVQFDKVGEAWFTLHDAGGDVAALAQLGTFSGGGARVVSQWTYDAYGSVHSADHLYAHPPSRVGHKGLFFDRLDVGVADSATWSERARLVPYAHVIGHVRNRAYNPQLGRWNQADPNATGQVVIDLAGRHGRRVMPGAQAFNLAGLFGDGVNLQQYVRSSPYAYHDPLGLRAIAAAGGLVPGPSDWVRGAYQSLISEYIANLSWDVSWASDWEQGDDWHSRTNSDWVLRAIVMGVYDSFSIGIPGTEYEFNPLDYMSAGGRGGGARTKIRVGGVTISRSYIERFDVPSGTYDVTFFQHPRHAKPFVDFPDEAIKDTIRITPRGNRDLDIEAANHSRRKPARYDWAAEYGGVPHTWHHDNVQGRMYLVPRYLHQKVSHTGGVAVWY